MNEPVSDPAPNLNPPAAMRTWSGYLLVALKGMAMGAADVVPGVSGGTIAFITGIYEELIDAIRAIGGHGLRLVWRRDFAEAWRSIHGGFLVALGFGIVLSIATLSRVVLYALNNHAEVLWAFFFGLVLGAVVVIAPQIRERGLTQWAWAVGGAGLGFAVASAVPVETPQQLPFIFVSGAIAICAMILPGVSGSFILVLLGKYEYVLSAVKAAQYDVLLAFMAGCAVGLLAFSHVLAWLFRRFHDATVALIVGFLVGSLPKIWPWKQTLQSYVDRHGLEKPLVQRNVSPWQYPELTGNEPSLALAIVGSLLGFILVVGIDRRNKRLRSEAATDVTASRSDDLR
ncbi:MAG: DUF368 domain-containing protein [Myxococcota bacterium]